MIAGCRVVELRADRTPGEQAQGAYMRIRAEQIAHGVDPLLATMLARLAAAAVARNAIRNGREHTRQGLVTERFVHDSEGPDWGDDSWSRADGQ